MSHAVWTWICFTFTEEPSYSASCNLLLGEIWFMHQISQFTIIDAMMYTGKLGWCTFDIGFELLSANTQGYDIAKYTRNFLPDKCICNQLACWLETVHQQIEMQKNLVHFQSKVCLDNQNKFMWSWLNCVWMQVYHLYKPSSTYIGNCFSSMRLSIE